MRRIAIPILGALLGFAGDPAMGGELCVTPLGWCEASEGRALASPCGCLTADGPVAGVPGAARRPNPLTELEPDAATRSVLGTGTLASRAFAGPSQLPPAEFRAYGLVVFKSRASRFDRDRHLMMCEAYMSALAHASEIDSPRAQQMVTIWPVARDEVVERIDALPAGAACEEAVEHYGLVHAQGALRVLEGYETPDGPYDTGGRGPFLVAWTPGDAIGAPGSVAMLMDLSHVRLPEEALEKMTLWHDRIQDNPELWEREVAGDELVDRVRRFFDRNGAVLRAAVGG